MTDAYTWQGRDVVGRDGEKIGSVKEIYEDERTGKPELALVTGAVTASRSRFVPLAGAEPSGEQVQVQVSKDQVKDARGSARASSQSRRSAGCSSITASRTPSRGR